MNSISFKKIYDTTSSPPFAIRIAFFFFLICVNSLVGKFVVFSFQEAPGVSYYYIAAALMIVFTLWFGMWGALAAYFGCFIGANLLSNIPPSVGLYMSFSDFWQVIIPFLACRYFNVDLSLQTRRDFFVILVFGVVINNFVGALWGSVSLAIGHVIAFSDISSSFYAWFIGNVVVCIIFVPLILRILTTRVKEHELFVKGIWN
jgi:integral membrane sensor domain MASE1